MMPPARKIVAESSDGRGRRCRAARRPSRANRNAMTTVAKTSKKPSTQRCTTHQRQYSAMARLVCRPAHRGRRRRTARSRPRRSGTARAAAAARPAARSAGQQRARPSGPARGTGRRTGRSARTGRGRCTRSPGGRTRSSASMPSFCWTLEPLPASEPTTMTSRRTNRKLTPSRWNRGSCPRRPGAMNRPVASHAVAIQKMPSCVCQVRVTRRAATSPSGMP